MKNYFEVVAKYDKENDKGQIKSVSEIYLFEAVNFGDAESLAHKELPNEIGNDFAVKAVKKPKYSEIIDTYKGEHWFKLKISFLDVDQKTGKEKTANELVLVSADSLKQAYEITEDRVKTVLLPWCISLISKTKIIDVIQLKND